jgi:hypothetical protein
MVHPVCTSRYVYCYWGNAHPSDGKRSSTENCRTRRCSEREPADPLRDESNVIGGWLPSLTFALTAQTVSVRMTHKSRGRAQPMRLPWLLVPLLSACLSACCTSRDTDRELNGLIRCGWNVSATPLRFRVYPLEVLCRANAKLQPLIEKQTGDFRSDCFLVPQPYGYDIVILTHERLSQQVQNEFHSVVQKAITEAQAEVQPLMPKQ